MSSTLETTVGNLSAVTHARPIRGKEEAREKHVSGVGALTGQLAGVGTGALLGLARAGDGGRSGAVPRPPATRHAMVGGAAPMMLRYRPAEVALRRPRSERARLGYGAVTAGAGPA